MSILHDLRPLRALDASDAGLPCSAPDLDALAEMADAWAAIERDDLARQPIESYIDTTDHRPWWETASLDDEMDAVFYQPTEAFVGELDDRDQSTIVYEPKPDRPSDEDADHYRHLGRTWHAPFAY